MADQTVNLEGDSGSRQNVAFKLWNVLRYSLPDERDASKSISLHLDLYSSCLRAANFQRNPSVDF